MPSIIPENTVTPGTHALVIGVSEYIHFDDGSQPTSNGSLLNMSQLSAAARSASEFASWLIDERDHGGAPLSSLRVLVSPSPGEVIHPTVSPLLTGNHSADRQNVSDELVEFRNVCALHRDNVAVVYAAGHGVQLTKTGSLLLLNDCGSPNHAQLLEGAIDMAGIHAAFNHPNTAKTQFWFVDACRQEPAIAARFETMSGALSLDEPTGVTDSTALFLAATTGTPAFARPGGLTLFNEALLAGLRGGIAVEPEPSLSNRWHISTHGLVKDLRPRVKALAAAEGADQTIDSVVQFQDALFHEYAVTPSVDLRIDLDPSAAHPGSDGKLTDGGGQTIAQTIDNWPIEETVDAGIYRLKIDTANPFKNFSNFLKVNPNQTNPHVDVTP